MMRRFGHVDVMQAWCWELVSCECVWIDLPIPSVVQCSLSSPKVCFWEHSAVEWLILSKLESMMKGKFLTWA